MEKPLQTSRSAKAVPFDRPKNKINSNRKCRFIFSALLLFGLLAGLAQRGEAQIYYLLNAGNGNTVSTNDALNKINEDGTGNAVVTSSVALNPSLLTVDAANNRAFVYSFFTGQSNVISIVNLSTGAITGTITPATPTLQITGLRYDPTGDFLYFCTSDANGTTQSTSDCLNRMKSDGTGQTVLVSGISKTPSLLALDIANNRVFVYESVAADRAILTVGLTSNTVTQTTAVSSAVGGMEYDPTSGLIYFTTNSGNGVQGVTDALNSMKPDGTSLTVIASSISRAPTLLTLDKPNNKAFFYESFGTDKAINSINLSTGAVAQVTTAPLLVDAISVPAPIPSTTINSLTKAGSTPTNATSVNFTATFGAAITGLTANNFSLTASSVSGASVGTPTTANGGTTWTVPVNTGTGDGSIQLNLANATGLSQGISTSLPYSGDTYTIDKTAPTIGSITATTPSNANPTNATSVTYTVTFSEAVTGVDASDFALNTSGTSGTVSGVSGSGASYAVTVSSITGAGTLRLDLNSTGTGITDAAGNAISGGFTTGSVYTIDRTAPTVSSIALADGNPTNATTVDYTVTFSEPVSGVTAGAFSLVTTSGNAAGAINSVIAVSTSVYTVNVTSVSGNGGLRLDLSNVSGISDLAGNQLASTFTGSVYTIDNTPATLTSGSYFSNNGNSSQYAKVGDQITLSVGYNEQLQSATMTIGGNTVPVSFSNSSHFSGVYTMASGDTEGNVPWTLSATDLAGNVRNYTNNDFGTVLIFDKTPPAISISAPSQATANAAGTVNYTVTYSDANFNFSSLSTGDITLNTTGTANATVGVSGSGTSYTVSLSNITGAGTIGFTIGAGTAQDIPGNQALASDPSTPFTIDNTPPTIAVSAPSAPSIGNNGTGTVSYTVTYADANFGSSTLGTGNISLNATGTANGTVGVTGSGTSYTVTISNISGLGTLGISIGAGTATDKAGNSAPASNASATFNVLASDAVLAKFSISNGILTPGFSPGTFTYTDAIGNLTSGIWVIPTTDDPKATVTVDGNPATSGVRTSTIPMSVGANTLTVVVTAQDGATTQTYTVTVNRPLPNIAALSSLALSPATTLKVTTGPGDYNYTAAVTNGTTSIQALPTAQDNLATITVNSSPVASGSLSQSIPLNVGANTITTVVTAEDGVAKKTYIITVNRAADLIATLSNLAVSAGTLGPVFSSSTTSYGDIVPYTTASVKLTPTTTDPNATVTVNGQAVASGALSQSITLNVGSNTVATVVTAQNGVNKVTYNTVVTRTAPATNAALASITATPTTTLVSTTGPGYLNFNANVANGTTSIQVTPTATAPTATITVNGSAVASGTLSQVIPLNIGANTITTVLTAQDGTTTKKVIITVTRAASSNTALANLTVNTGTLAPAFTAATNNYSVSVPNTVNQIGITPTTADATATITVGGAPATSGSQALISLALGLNTIPVTVTAQNGAKHTYNVNVTRVPSADAALASITLAPSATLNGATGTGYYNYAASVGFSTANIQVTPVTTDATATVTVNGSAVASGSLSQSIPLNVGANTITAVVTAQDGTTTRTAIITVTRAGSAVSSLANLAISAGTLSPAFATGTLIYTASVAYPNASVTLTPTTTDPNATVTVNGSPAATPVALSVGTNKIVAVVTAQNGTATSTYTTYVTRAQPSTNALYTSIVLSPASTLVATTGTGDLNYTSAVDNSEASVQVVATAKDATATITVNGQAVTSGSPSQAIALNVGSNTITTVITAQDGVTSKSAIITVTRAMPSANTLYNPISVTKPLDNVTLEDGITVHQAVSPNGDGINDYLTIDGITSYPDNNLMIVDRNGVMIYQTKGYDNSSKLFDGHSSINGKMQLPGTYFYSLDYTAANGENKHKTGYIILKY